MHHRAERSVVVSSLLCDVVVAQLFAPLLFAFTPSLRSLCFPVLFTQQRFLSPYKKYDVHA
jgi:hypothetical protein